MLIKDCKINSNRDFLHIGDNQSSHRLIIGETDMEYILELNRKINDIYVFSQETSNN